MHRQITSAVFDNRAEAERAIGELRSAGVSDKAISVVGRHEGHSGHGDHKDGDHDGDSTRTGLGVGIGAGALLGFASLLIPGVGPFIAGGALAETLGAAGAIGAGAAIGGAAGGLAGALKEHGVSDEDSRYYEDRINQGGIFVSVDTSHSGVSEEVAREILFSAGGHTASRARAAAH
jgi:hypothetical protein